MFQLPSEYDKVRYQVDKEFVFDPEGRWRTPAINRSPLCRPTPKVKKVIIHDDTLREGLNTVGVYPTIEGKLKIAEKLEEAGIEELEGGYPDIREHAEFMKRLKHSGTKMKLSGVVLNSAGDFRVPIDAAVEAGVDQIRIFAMQMSYTMSPNLNLEASIDLFRSSIMYTKEQGKFTAVGPLGITSLDMIREVATAAVEAGADRVYVNDSQGAYTPEAVSLLVRFIRDIVGDDTEIAFHGHDDYGLATINAVQAIIAGANVVDVSVNKMCHRSGLAGFAEVVLALETLYDIKTGIDLAKVFEVCKVVENQFGIPIPPNNPHSGDSQYLTLGYHSELAGGNRWWIWENIKAESIGQKRKELWTPTVLDRGGMNGAVANKVKSMGFILTETQLNSIFDRLRALFMEKKYATNEETEQIIRDVCV